MARLLCVLLAFLSLSVVAGEPDYRAERLKLASDPGYNAYSLALVQKTLLEEHFRLANDPDVPINEVNAPLKKLFDLYPLGIQVNLAVAGFMEYLAKQSEPADAGLLEVAKARRGTADAILRSILDSGDGKTAGTAYQVINTIEEYAVLDYLGLEPTSQSLVTAPGGNYDLFSARDKDGVEHSVFFDISLFFGRRAAE